MSATRRLPQITALMGAVAVSIAAIAKPTVRDRIIRALGVNVPGGTWRLLAIAFAVINLKNWPFVWHYRLFSSLIYHLFIQPTVLPPSSLFQPLITPSHTPIAETDYNFHKSNSTYFTDLDIARTHLVTALLRQGIRGVGTHPDEKGNTGFSFRNTSRAAGHKEKKARRKSVAEEVVGQGMAALGASGTADAGGEEKRREAMTEEEWFAAATEPGNLLIALGAVSCHFHREVAPYKRYEIWTRLLTWDRKWMYIVSHFVEADAFTPESYALQPWKKRKVPKGGVRGRWEDLSEGDRRKLARKVFASSIAKYVVKKGRLTVPPEMVLERSRMLPPRPPGTMVLGGWSPQRSVSPSLGGDTASPSGAESSGDNSENSPTKMVLEESLFAAPEQAEGWTWERVQEERLKGLKLAEAYDSLEGLKDVFAGGEGQALGEFSDLVWGI